MYLSMALKGKSVWRKWPPVLNWRPLRFVTAVDQPQELSDAVALEGWILSRGENRIEMREILRLGPAQLRNRQRRDAAISRLVDFGHASEVVISGRAHLCLNPRPRAGT
jgi:hypothetical protein